MRPILLLDGNSLLNRAHFGLGVYTRLTATDGTPTAAVYSFLNSLIAWLEEYDPQGVFVAWDVSKKTFRHEIFPEYKGGRPPMDEDLRLQFPVAKKILKQMGIKNFGLESYEADDLIGTAAKAAKAAGVPAIIISGDRDLYQLVAPGVTVLRPTTRAGKPVQFTVDEAAFFEHYGFTPESFIDYRALVGDSSDGLPGVKGIGEKTASKLIRKYQDLDQIYEHLEDLSAGQQKNLKNDRENAYKTKELSRINCDSPIDLKPENLDYQPVFTAELRTTLQNLGLRTIIKKLEELCPDSLEWLEFDLEQGEAEAEPELRQIESFTEFLDRLANCEQRKLLILSSAEAAAGAEESEDDKLNFYLADNSYFTTPFAAFNPTRLSALAELADQIYVHDIKEKFRRLAFTKPDLAIFDFKVAAYLLSEGMEETHSLAELLEARGHSLKGLPQSAFKLAEEQSEALAEKGMTELAYEIEFPLAELLARMELSGIYVDRAELKSFAEELSEEVSALEKQIYELAGSEFNLNSSQQLAKVLYEDLALPSGKKTKSGYASTAVDELKRLEAEHPIIPLLLQYRELSKLLNGFVLSLDKYIESDGRIHTHFNQLLTATGRLSSAEPNLQNIPIRSEKGREIRRVFKATPGKLLLSADYSQIELRLLAAFSGDENLTKAFREGQDIHRMTALNLFPELEEIGQRERAIAKTVNFSIVYGISAFSLAGDLKLSVAEAKRYIDSYHRSYPKVQPWLDAQVKAAEESGYVSTMLGRRRALPELKAKNYNSRQYAVRQAMNAPVQGSAADLIKVAMLKVDRAIRKAKLDAKLILQIHDELILELDPADLSAVSELLHQEMIEAYDIGLPLETSLDEGESWYEL
ncbi:MAG: DNA polymerase I [Eubacteriales bacterium]|nr:DNA polymerase I [Eubacteriales bacterium]